MITNNQVNSDTPLLRIASRKHRLIAFGATSLAAFLLTCLWWPLNMQGYRCEALIEFDNPTEGSELVATQLPSVLKSVMEPAVVSRKVERIGSAFPKPGQLIGSRDIDAISRRIKVGFREATRSRAAQLRVVFAGTGQPAEAEFTRSIAADIAARLAVEATPDGGKNSVATSEHRKLDQATWLVDQIEEGVASARNQSAELSEFARSDNQGSAFKNVGHVRALAHPAISNLHQTLESVDVSSLRGVIGQIENERLSEMNGHVRFDPDLISNEPVGAVPDSASLLLAGLASLLVGGVVAWNVLPFAEKGFANVDDVANQLGVPVVATLAGEPSHSTNEPKSDHVGWANHVFRLSGTVIMAIGILGIGFWLISADVREAFSQNVFHGFARIVWLFTGV